MADTVDRVLVQLEARIDGYNRDVNAAAANFDRRMIEIEASSTRAGAAIRGVVTGAIAALGAQQLYQLAKGALDYASSLGEVAQQLGVTTKELQVFQYAGSQVGLSNEETREGLSKLTRTLGEAATGAPKAQKALQLVGFSLDELKTGSVTAGAAIPRIADFLAKVESPAQRAAIEIELFGRAGQRLDTLLSGGSGAIDELSGAAEKLGIVLSDDQIQRADDTADKLSAVKQVLEANIAGVVANNAQSILGLASALGALTGKVLEFLGSNPQLALTIVGGLAGARAGPVGLAAGALGGAFLGQKVADANTDLRFRAKALRDARNAYSNAPEGSRFKEEQKAEVERQIGLGRTAVAAALANRARSQVRTGSADPALQAQLAALNAPKPAKTPSAAKGSNAATDHSAEYEARYQNKLERLRSDELDALADLNGTIGARYESEKRRIVEDRRTFANDVSIQKGLTDQKRAELIAANEKVLEIRTSIADQQRFRALATRDYDLGKAALDAQREEIDVRSQLADSIGERRTLELQMLENRKAAERLYLEKVLSTSPTDSADYQNALDRQRALDGSYAGQAAVARRRNQSPGDAFLTTLNRSTSAIDEDMQSVAVSGLQSLNDGLTDAIVNGKSLGDVFHNVSQQIIGDLLRIAIQQAVIKPLAQALFGKEGSSGGGIGGLLTQIGSAVGSAFGGGGQTAAQFQTQLKGIQSGLPGFATGGSMRLGGRPGVDTNLLSLNGRPLARVSAGETLNIDPSRRAASSGGAVIVAPQHYDLSGVVMTEDLVHALRADNREYARKVAAVAGQAAVKAAPGEVQRVRRYGG